LVGSAVALSTLAVGLLGSTAASVPAVAASGAGAAAHEVLVTGSAAAVAAARAVASKDPGYIDLRVIRGFAVKATAQQQADFAASGLRVSPDQQVSVTDADWGAGSHSASAIYPQVDGAPSAWAQGINGSGVSVAVIDTGISNTGDLAGKVIDGYDFSGEGNPTTDSFGHGTFVAGVIAGSGAASNGAIKGVAPGVNLVSLKVAGADGSSDVVRVIAAIQWAVDNAAVDNIRVLNLSLGTDSTQSWRIDPLDAAVEGAWRAGLFVAVAAGNNGAGGISKPGDDPYVVTVGATDDATTVTSADDTVAPFSSTGPTSAGIAKPDLVAPGAHVVSTRSVGSTVDTNFPAARIDLIYFRGSGTSFSAPQVAGAAALLLQQRPQLTNNQLKALLTGTAVPLPGVPATAQGAGELNVAAALTASPGQPANTGLGSSNGAGSAAASEGSLAAAGAPTGGDSPAWNAAPWNSTAWNSTAWNSTAWNSTGWNSTAWNSTAWNSTAWNSTAWNSTAWNSTAWNSTGWNSTAWNSTGWNSVGWTSMGFWSSAWQ
jgi:serine protease AprX